MTDYDNLKNNIFFSLNNDKGTYPEYGNKTPLIKYFKQNNSEIVYFDNYNDTIEFLKNNLDFQVYTELHHSEKYYPLFLDRGFHICNKTNRYVCVKSENFKPMEYVFN